MTTLTELNELQQQVQTQQEKVQELYSGTDYSDDEVQYYVTSMVDHIAQMECLQALIALENFATKNGIELKDLAVGTKVKETEPLKIEATYLRTDWLFKNKERTDRIIIDINQEQEVIGIYYDYKYNNENL
jgi:hypothetical protein